MSNKTVSAEQAIKNYMEVRKSGALEQGVWFHVHEDATPGLFGIGRTRQVVKRACALGAAFRQTGEFDVVAVACPNDTLPAWLVHSTPNLFDMQSTADAFAWADAIYQPGGLLDRSSKLSAAKRREMWENAAKLIDCELETNVCMAAAFNRHMLRSSLSHNNLHFLIHYLGHKEDRARLAGTVLDCIDQALTEAGV